MTKNKLSMLTKNVSHLYATFFVLAVFASTALIDTKAFADSSWAFRAGPPSVGRGGTNPASIPPFNPGEWEFSYVSSGGVETNISVVPGILIGQRFFNDGFYTSLGGGLVIDLNSAGLGGYAAFGYITGEGNGSHFNIEYKQAIGYGDMFIAPSALRMGISYHM